MNKDYLYSYHVFLFPFEWSYAKDYSAKKTIEEKTDLMPLLEMLQNTDWKRKPFKLDTRLHYNEYNYFYDFVRDVLYDKDVDDLKPYIAHHRYDIEPETWEYSFEVKIGNKIKEYKLAIDSILLHLYSSGVGVLSFHLNNRLEEQSQPDDILRINQYGRRLYPPFFGFETDKPGTQAQYEKGFFDVGLEISQGIEMPLSLTIGDKAYREDFSRYRTDPYFAENPFQLPKCFEHLFKGIRFTTASVPKADGDIKIVPLLDDRMFVVCWYGNNLILRKQFNGKRGYQNNDDWYKLLFVDGGLKSCQNDEMTEDLIKRHTSARWSKFETLFGASRYSFICLTNSLERLRSNNTTFIINHVQTMYYRIVELCLVQRASILKFSNEVSEISAMNDKDISLLAQKVQTLYKEYIRFANKIYFREVTPQEQGIELYDLLQVHMKIKDHAADLDAQIEELHNYVIMVEETDRNRNIAWLTTVGTAFIIPGFIISYLGIGRLDRLYNQSFGVALLLLSLIILPLLLYIWTRESKGLSKWKTIVIVLLLLCILVIVPFLLFNDGK